MSNSSTDKSATGDKDNATQDPLWVMRAAQSMLRAAALPPQVADRAGREIARFLSDPAHMRAAIDRYGTDDGLEIANLMVREGLKQGITWHPDLLSALITGESPDSLPPA